MIESQHLTILKPKIIRFCNGIYNSNSELRAYELKCKFDICYNQTQQYKFKKVLVKLGLKYQETFDYEDDLTDWFE